MFSSSLFEKLKIRDPSGKKNCGYFTIFRDSLLLRPKGTWGVLVGMEEVFCVCGLSNSFGQPINLFMSVLDRLFDLSDRET